MNEKIIESYKQRPRKAKLYWTITIIVALILIWAQSGITFKGVTERGLDVARGIAIGIIRPDMDLLLNTSDTGVPYLILQTVAIAVLGTIFGSILAIPVSFLSSENIMPRWFANLMRIIILLIRTIPSLVWALMWIRVTGPGPFCGVVTQSICSIGMISKMYITAIEDLDTGILESLDAAGCNTFEKIRCGILPQLYASFISTSIYRFDINIKDAAILGIVGAGGIGASMMQAIGSRRWNMVGSFLVALIILVLVIEWVSTRIRRKLATGN